MWNTNDAKRREKISSNASTTIKTTKNNDNSVHSIEIVFAIENGDFGLFEK